MFKSFLQCIKLHDFVQILQTYRRKQLAQRDQGYHWNRSRARVQIKMHETYHRHLRYHPVPRNWYLRNHPIHDFNSTWNLTKITLQVSSNRFFLLFSYKILYKIFHFKISWTQTFGKFLLIYTKNGAYRLNKFSSIIYFKDQRLKPGRSRSSRQIPWVAWTISRLKLLIISTSVPFFELNKTCLLAN